MRRLPEWTNIDGLKLQNTMYGDMLVLRKLFILDKN